MKKKQMNNIKDTKDQVPTFLTDSYKNETEENFSYPSDLPVFYTTSEQREVMNKVGGLRPSPDSVQFGLSSKRSFE